MRRVKLSVLLAAAVLGLGAGGLSASAGSSLCPSNRVCTYVNHEWVGLLGYRAAGGALVNVSSGANDQMSSWENKTATNARWYFNANGGGACRNMLANRELNISWYGGDNDQMTSWATNGACPS